MWGLYDRLNLRRIYFSAYQKIDNADSGNLFSSHEPQALSHESQATSDVFVREHRLYQVDFLLRRYGFSESDIVFDETGNLPLDTDPKESWAKRNPQYFPVDVNKASRNELLRVPGLGQITVDRILEHRKTARITTISDVGKTTSRLNKANSYLAF
jgi:predicted DNA-binding helix-hairpin-helix protein